MMARVGRSWDTTQDDGGALGVARADRGDDGGVPAATQTWAGSHWSSPVTRAGAGRVHTRRQAGQAEVLTVGVDGSLDELAGGLDHTVQCALAEFPRAVVCVLPDRLRDVGRAALDTVASVGRHARVWPDTPVVMTSRDPHLVGAVGRRPQGRYLRYASSLDSALAQAGLQPPLRTTRLHLPASPTAARLARRALARACEEWGVPGCRGTGELVVSELVTNALQHAHSDLDLVLASDGARMVRLGVRDPLRVAPATRLASEDSLGGRGLHIVQSVAESAGALPTADGGKVVWATLVVDGGLS